MSRRRRGDRLSRLAAIARLQRRAAEAQWAAARAEEARARATAAAWEAALLAARAPAATAGALGLGHELALRAALAAGLAAVADESRRAAEAARAAADGAQTALLERRQDEERMRRLYERWLRAVASEALRREQVGLDEIASVRRRWVGWA